MSGPLFEGTDGRPPTSASVALDAERLVKAAPLVKRVEEIDRRLPVIEAERREKTRGPLPAAELTQRLVALIRAARERHEAGEMAQQLVSALTRGDFEVGREAIVPLLLLLLGPELEKQAAAAVKRCQYPAGSPLTSAERASVEAKAQAERASLEAERERLVDQVNALGVPLAHQPEVKARRDHERRVAEEQAARALLPPSPPLPVWVDRGDRPAGPGGKLHTSPTNI